MEEATDHTFQKKCPATTDVFDKFKGGKHCDTFSWLRKSEEAAVEDILLSGRERVMQCTPPWHGMK